MAEVDYVKILLASVIYYNQRNKSGIASTA
jgi:hypothetical protein